MSTLEDHLKKPKARQPIRDQAHAEGEAIEATNRITVQEGEPIQVDTALAAALESLHRHWTERKAAEQQATPPLPRVEPKEQLILFPPWADNRRATAQAIFRSALFPALNNKQPRRYLEQERLTSVEGVTIFFTGKQFSQSDLDVYLELLQIAHETPFGVECTFTAYSLLKALGRSTGKADYRQLHAEIIRLCAGVVDMTDHGVRYFDSLVHGGTLDEDTKRYRIFLAIPFARFFKSGLWASLDIQQRRALGRNQTAKALHAYYSTHAAPGPHTYAKLAGLVGLHGKNSRDVKAKLIKAHEALKQVGFCPHYEAGTTTIEAVINQTPTQTRHLVRKIIKARRQRRTKGMD